jgi:hypothetical protein
VKGRRRKRSKQLLDDLRNGEDEVEGLGGKGIKQVLDDLRQRFSNFFQVGTTFISQNVLRTTLLLSPLKANCLIFSTVVCDTQFTLILFFLSFLD